MVTVLHRPTSALLLVLGILGLLAFETWRSHLAAQEEAERNVVNLVKLLSEQTARTIQSIDLSLQSVAAEAAGTPNLTDNDPRFGAEMRKRLSSLPFVRALFVVGADGLVSQDTNYAATPRTNVADRAYFAVQRDDISAGLYIDAPLRSRTSGDWIIALSRRIDALDGHFAGVAVALVDPMYFERFYSQLWIGGGNVALFRKDGVELARSPHIHALIGTSAAGRETFRRFQDGSAPEVFWGTSPINGIERVASFRALENLPLVMLVTMSKAVVMRAWRTHMTVTGVGAAIIIVMFAGIETLTRRHRLQEERAKARLVEAERLESIGRFAAGVAHDVGNLQRIIRSAVLLLRPEVADRQKAGELLDQIDATLTVGGELVAQLLSHARTGHRAPGVNDLNLVISEALPMLHRAAGPKVEVSLSTAASALPCRIDRPQFLAVMLNLILNARDAMPNGGTVFLEVRDERALGQDGPGWSEIRVSDNGQGMSEAILGQALDPFFTTKTAGQGSGLGLSQVQTFIDDSQGSLEITSEQGKGTTIRLRLPLAEVDHAEETRSRALPSASDTACRPA